MNNDTAALQPQKDDVEEWSIKALWMKYEEIAMHFNDLLIKLRTQALGVVAAISALVGIFGKSGISASGNWEVASLAFLILCMFWVAIWIIDFCYYNRLLTGAVAAILELEDLSKTRLRVRHINISTKIEDAVIRRGKLETLNTCETIKRNVGRWAFYVIVFLALLAGLYMSYTHRIVA